MIRRLGSALALVGLAGCGLDTFGMTAGSTTGGSDVASGSEGAALPTTSTATSSTEDLLSSTGEAGGTGESSSAAESSGGMSESSTTDGMSLSTNPESTLLVQYGECHKPNFAWALNPSSSCVAPGCDDPYADAPITWTSRDGSVVAPFFADETLSHMPLCNQGQAPNKGCFGSGTYTHLGLVAVQNNLATFKAQCMVDPQDPCDGSTQFVNILITDGQSNSTLAQYQPPLTEMYGQGVTTYVIGYGEGVDTPAAIATLNLMADSGSGNALDYYDANNPGQLMQAIIDIVEGLNYTFC